MADLFTFSSSALPDDVRVLNFRLVEAINAPYELLVHFLVGTADDVDLADAIGAKATLVADRGDGGAHMQWGGLLAHIEHLHQVEKGAIFGALVVPPLWFLQQGEHSRVFTKLPLNKFVTKVLEEAGFTSSDFELRLNADPPEEEHVCQYRESDLAFIQRWFEREGLFYFFEQSDDGPKMVITDRTPTESLRDKPVRYFPSFGDDVSSQEAIQRFRATRASTLRAIRLRDYDYMKPTLDVKGKADASSNGSMELLRFGDRFFAPGDGDRLAKVRAEALLAREELYVATGTAMLLRAGYVFELESHPRGPLNKKYLATRLEHVGVESSIDEEVAKFLGVNAHETYRVEIQAVDAALPYRAPLTTPWPRISGQEVALVDGPANSEYAQLDDAGRYLVKFMFDENRSDDGKASTRVRMMQPHAGTPEGFHFPLRKGTEVVVIFLGGDPDRPVIAGAIPNALTPSPVTAKNHTHNIVITGGRNHIDMEDKDGSQYVNICTPSEKTEIHMGAPKDWKDIGKNASTVRANLGEHTDGTGAFSFGGDWRINVGAEKEEHVVSNVIEDYDAQVDETYKGPKNETVTNKVTEKFNSGHETAVKGLRKVTITGAMEEKVTAGLTQTINTGRTQTITGGDTQTISGGRTQTVNGALVCHWTTSAALDGPDLSIDFGKVQITGKTNLGLKSADTKFNLGIWDVKAGVTTWKNGAITWDAPSASLTIPNWENKSASTWQTGVNAQTAYVFTMAIAGVAIAIAPVNIGIVPALNVALKAFYLENKGISIATSGMKARVSGLTAFS